MSLSEKRKFNRLQWIAFAWLLCFFAVSCNEKTRRSDDDPVAPTVHILRAWETALMVAIEHGFQNGIDDPTFYKTLEEAILDLKQKRAFDVPSMDVRHDAWGNAFLWQVVTGKGSKTIRVISKGADGISQDGKGDDVTLEIHILPQGGTKVMLTRPDTK